jgi:hypothetical protein
MPNTYTPQSEIARRQALMEAMAGRNTTGQGIGGGLANMLRSYRGGKENAALGQAEAKNASMDSAERQMMIQQLGQGSAAPGVLKQGVQYNYETPDMQNLQLKQAMSQSNLRDQQAREDAIARKRQEDAMQLQQLKNDSYASRGVSGGGQLAGQNIIDTENGNQVVGTFQNSRTGAPVMYSVSGGPLEWKDSYQIVGSAAQGNQTPSVLNTAAPAQASAAEGVATAQQNALTAGANQRGVAADTRALGQDTALANQGLQQEITRLKSSVPALEAEAAGLVSTAQQTAQTVGAEARGNIENIQEQEQQRIIAAQELQQAQEEWAIMSPLRVSESGAINQQNSDIALNEWEVKKAKEFDAEMAEAKRLNNAEIRSYTDATQRFDTWVDDAIEMSGVWNNGFIGNMLSAVKGTGAYNLRATLESMAAFAGFETLNDMRQRSPTGGALGQVSEKELALLVSAFGSLDQAQSPRMFRRRVVEAQNAIQTILKRKIELGEQMSNPYWSNEPVGQLGNPSVRPPLSSFNRQ